MRGWEHLRGVRVQNSVHRIGGERARAVVSEHTGLVGSRREQEQEDSSKCRRDCHGKFAATKNEAGPASSGLVDNGTCDDGAGYTKNGDDGIVAVSFVDAAVATGGARLKVKCDEACNVGIRDDLMMSNENYTVEERVGKPN